MNWWSRFIHRKQLETQLAKELQFHLEDRAADLAAQGLNPVAAMRQAQIEIGGKAQVEEECRDARGTRWLEDAGRDLRYALRTIRQKPGFAAVALVTLALGTGATTVMFSVISGVLLKPLPFPQPDRLVVLHERMEKGGDDWNFSYPGFLDTQRESRALDMAAWTYSGGTMTSPGDAGYVNGRMVTSGMLSVFGVNPIKGRGFLAQEDRAGGAPVAIISYELWQRRFGGSPETVGRWLTLDGNMYKVVGVLPAAFQNAGEFGDADIFTLIGQNTEPRTRNYRAHIMWVVARLRHAVKMPAVEAELALIARHRAAAFPLYAAYGMVAGPLLKEVVGDVQNTLWLLLGAVSLVLLIACANVASLLLARAVARERELVMRAALGANRSRLVRQCLTESAVLGICGGAVGLALAVVALRPFLSFWPGSLPRAAEIGLDWRVLVFTCGISLLCGVLFGLAPALRIPVGQLEQTLRASGRTLSGGSRRLHAGFVISEIALAVILLVTAGILGRSMLRLSVLNPGVNPHNLLTARVTIPSGALDSPAHVRVAWQELLDRVGRLPGVQSAALSDIIPMRRGENEVPYSTSAAPPPLNKLLPMALASSVTPDDRKVLRLPLLRGRFFTDHDRIGSQSVVVIDEVLARHAFGTQDAVGKLLWSSALSDAPVQVVGVVGHVRHWGLAADDGSAVRDQMYYPLAQVPDSLLHFFSSVMSIVIRTDGPPLAMIEPLQRQLRAGAGDQVLYDVHTMEQLMHTSLDRQRFLMFLFGVFAGLALLLACIGIYGVLTYITGRRAPEIGVRMALGAKARDVRLMVFRQTLGMTFGGVLIGGAGAWGAGRLLQKLVAGVQAADPVTIGIPIVALVIAALLASFLPAWRASSVDPIRALRQE
ncbi:MAG TPA: ABC transporter permease [Terracidiphilus sp.]